MIALRAREGGRGFRAQSMTLKCSGDVPFRAVPAFSARGLEVRAGSGAAEPRCQEYGRLPDEAGLNA